MALIFLLLLILQEFLNSSALKIHNLCRKDFLDVNNHIYEDISPQYISADKYITQCPEATIMGGYFPEVEYPTCVIDTSVPFYYKSDSYKRFTQCQPVYKPENTKNEPFLKPRHNLCKKPAKTTVTIKDEETIDDLDENTILESSDEQFTKKTETTNRTVEESTQAEKDTFEMSNGDISERGDNKTIKESQEPTIVKTEEEKTVFETKNDFTSEKSDGEVINETRETLEEVETESTEEIFETGCGRKTIIEESLDEEIFEKETNEVETNEEEKNVEEKNDEKTISDTEKDVKDNVIPTDEVLSPKKSYTGASLPISTADIFLTNTDRSKVDLVMSSDIPDLTTCWMHHIYECDANAISPNNAISATKVP